jgi:predicted secreted hydrolase
VEGNSWMDHEFFSHSMESNQAGWDWFSLQFDDGSELMLYRLRRKDGTTEPLSSGTYVDPSGKQRHLRLADFEVKPGEKWKDYPVDWTVRVPSLRIDVQVRTRLKQQELVAKYGALPTYWEGAIEVSGSHRGAGYLEMTGYAGAVRVD